ncbi:MAG: glycosyl transferase family 9 [Rhodocyclaceae bacterium]|nr:glycosyl transferase family 9 [Rhodocyclaceae bacterium]
MPTRHPAAARRERRDPHPRIAVFRALQLGDLLCAVPALRALRHALPAARITLIGLPWAADFARRISYVDDFLEFPGFPGLPEKEPDPAALPNFFAEARRRRFHLAIQMHGSGGITNPLVAQLEAEHTAGFVVPGSWCPEPEFFIPWPEALPETRRLLALAEHLGAPPQGEQAELPLLPGERAAFTDLRSRLPVGERGYVCIHPGARLPSRRWGEERFARVADGLAADGLAVVLTGTREEGPLLARLQAAMATPAIDLAGHTSLGTLAALVAEARLVVCNDTGMSHVAAAVGTPSVVVACGSDPGRWRPLDEARHRVLWHPVACRPCLFEHCPTGHECAAGVAAEAVLAEARRLLAESLEKPHVIS